MQFQVVLYFFSFNFSSVVAPHLRFGSDFLCLNSHLDEYALFISFEKRKIGGKMSNKDAYWAKTKNHMIVTLVLWFFFSLVIFMFGTEMNTMSFLGYPLAYYMTAQGSLLAFVIMLFWTANKQEKIDEEHGFSEREED